MGIQTNYEFNKKTSGVYVNDLVRNLVVLKATERFAEDKRRVVGWIFLNEILDRLDLELQPYGYQYGWAGDDIVDFGLAPYFEDGAWIDIPNDVESITLSFKNMRNIETEWFDVYNSKKKQ